MSQWEYRTLEGPPHPAQINAACIEQGKQGWELCALMPLEKDLTGGLLLKDLPSQVQRIQAVAVLVFKRPIGWEASEQSQTEPAGELAGV